MTLPPPCLIVGTTHVERMRSPSLRLTNTLRFDPNISNLDSSVHKTDFHSSDVQFLCFLAQASLFFLFITLSSGFFAAILPFRPASRNLLWTVDVETSVLLVAFNWACISGAVNRRFNSEICDSNELVIWFGGHPWSAWPLSVLKSACLFELFDSLGHCSDRQLQSSCNFSQRLTLISQSNCRLSFLFTYLGCFGHFTTPSQPGMRNVCNCELYL